MPAPRSDMADPAGDSPRPGPSPTTASQAHAWELTWHWHLLVLTALATLAVLVYVAAEPGWRWVAVGLLVALGMWYLLAGRLLPGDDFTTARGWLVAGGMLALSAPVVAIAPVAAWGIFALGPLYFMLAGRWGGLVCVAVLMLASDVQRFLAGDLTSRETVVTLAIYILVLTFCGWLSGWIQRIISQSSERATLVEQLRQSRAEVARLSEEAGAAAERAHLAREIHDTLTQGFTSIVTLAQAVESELNTAPEEARRHVAMMRQTAQDNLAEARAIVAEQEPAALAGSTLDAALRRSTERLGAELGITARVTVQGQPRRLDPEPQVQLLRAGQEALANARRHAAATRVDVELTYTADSVALEVRDDGNGFAPDATPPGTGLWSMRQRAEEAGGHCAVASRPGAGTVVRLELPMTWPGPGA
ncbi:sensor histidine kinase [Lipingzhangella sp. LS1_29]|uniref:Oxygen sensor histidine kinase NreB n=1 Tax=Lipingzhangella rawalii TaxID=2055835 RepID=A0ABU2HA81_9ACTN|nr:sensor histidine kinase [Lipingzhangella rawalii]MDS1272234.1 sensor histidine kinase [Lipingzhangella rawalii]